MGINLADLAVTGALVYTLVNFMKNAVNWNNGGENATVTQLIAWAAGLAAVFLVSSAHVLGATEIINHVPLQKLSIGDKALAGLLVGSAPGVVSDAIKAFDNTTSAAHPALLARYRARKATQAKTHAAKKTA
jgi:hypothetical protein